MLNNDYAWDQLGSYAYFSRKSKSSARPKGRVGLFSSFEKLSKSLFVLRFMTTMLVDLNRLLVSSGILLLVVWRLTTWFPDTDLERLLKVLLETANTVFSLGMRG